MNIFQMEVDKAMNTSETSKDISVNLICPRFENAYIVDPSKSESLRKSIQANGLIQPINVIDLFQYMESNGYGPSSVGCDKTDEYLDRCISYRNTLPEEEKAKLSSSDEYADLMKNLERHVRYIISSGHRRFYAYVSLLLGRPINNRTEWEEAYPEIRKAVRENNEWKQIPVILIDNSEKEYAIYNDSNTTQRELTSFEVVVNTIDEMKKNGEWDKICKKAVEDYVDGMNDRTVKRFFNKFEKMGLSVESKEDMKKFSNDLFPVDSAINLAVAEYIETNKQRTVPISTIRNFRRMLDKLDKTDFQKIFDGKMTIREANNLISKTKNDADTKNVNPSTKSAQVVECVKKASKAAENLSKNIEQLIELDCEEIDLVEFQRKLNEIQKQIKDKLNKISEA